MKYNQIPFPLGHLSSRDIFEKFHFTISWSAVKVYAPSAFLCKRTILGTKSVQNGYLTPTQRVMWSLSLRVSSVVVKLTPASSLVKTRSNNSGVKFTPALVESLTRWNTALPLMSDTSLNDSQHGVSVNMRYFKITYTKKIFFCIEELNIRPNFPARVVKNATYGQISTRTVSALVAHLNGAHSHNLKLVTWILLNHSVGHVYQGFFYVELFQQMGF